MFLTADEIAELTGRRRCNAQVRVLRFMGIEHRQRPDGSIAVSRSHVDSLLGAGPASTKIKEYEIDLGTVR